MVQDPGAWYVRACPGVKRAFEEFWETPEPRFDGNIRGDSARFCVYSMLIV